MAGLEVSEETLALDIIDEVGPAGDFMGHKHTVKHLRRSVWNPYVVSHNSYDRWAADGAKDYASRAREYAKELVRSHQPQAIDDSMEATLRELCNILQ